MKVYVLLWHNDDPGHGIEAIYRDQDKALEEAERLEEIETYCFFTVEEVELF